MTPDLLLSLDTETYGAFEADAFGATLPPQTSYNPQKAIALDAPPPHSLIPLASITTFSHNLPLASPTPTPTDTRVLTLHLPAHRTFLSQWLRRSHTLIGMNLLYDLLWLRRDPTFRHNLTGNHLIIDLGLLRFLWHDTLDARSLKDLGPLLHLFQYDEAKTLRHGHRFPHPLHPDALEYSALDAHYSAVLFSYFISRIPHLTPSILKFHSDTVWACLRMTEAGVPFSHSRLLSLHNRKLTQSARLSSICSTRYSLTLSGKGSNTSKATLLSSALDTIPSSSTLPLETTPTKKQISLNDFNRDTILSSLPPSSPYEPPLRLWRHHAKFQKILSSYTYPLLFHARRDPTNRRSILLPGNSNCTGDILLGYPSWYPFPSSFKDGNGGSGGTQQGRITCKDPAVQTFPPIIKHCMRSRFDDGCLVIMDLSQIELRVAGLLSGEPTIVSEYNRELSGEKPDLHRARAISILGPSCLNDPYFGTGDSAKDPRQLGKTVNFADLFRASARRMYLTVLEAAGTAPPLSFFQSIENQRPHDRPTLWAWQESLLESAQSTGHLTLPLVGTKRSFPGNARRDHLNEIVNFPVQTLAASTLLAFQHALHPHLPSLNSHNPPILLFNNCYDALYFDLRTSHLPFLTDLLSSVRTELITNGFWASLCSLYTPVPLKYGIEILH